MNPETNGCMGYDIVRKVVAGGPQRQDSVYNGFQALEESTEIAVVHDGVRPSQRHK